MPEKFLAPIANSSSGGSQAAGISTRSLGKTFTSPQGETIAFQDFNLDIRAGEFVCLLGPSGCGKTSFLRTLAGLDAPSTGQLTIKQSRDEQVRLAMVFQEHGLFPWMSVKNNIRFPLENSAHFREQDLDQICEHFLQRIGLEKFADYFPDQLSGGMRQRASIARAYAIQPQLLLLDEPFVFLDYQTRFVLQDLLLQLWQEHQSTVVLVTHDIEEAVMMSDRIFILSRHPGRIKREISVELPRPRDLIELKKHPLFINLVAEITDEIRNEINLKS